MTSVRNVVASAVVKQRSAARSSVRSPCARRRENCLCRVGAIDEHGTFYPRSMAGHGPIPSRTYQYG